MAKRNPKPRNQVKSISNMEEPAQPVEPHQEERQHAETEPAVVVGSDADRIDAAPAATGVVTEEPPVVGSVDDVPAAFPAADPTAEPQQGEVVSSSAPAAVVAEPTENVASTSTAAEDAKESSLQEELNSSAIDRLER